MEKFISTILQIIKTKYIFKKPPIRNIAFFDGMSIDPICKKLNKRDFEIIFTRWEQINLYVLFLLLLKFKLNKKNYFIEYIRIINPKVIITVIDNSTFFYELKDNFPEKKFVAIQNGYRTENRDFFIDMKKNNIKGKKLKCDLIFIFNDVLGKEYKKYISCKTMTIGSFRNNFVSKANNFKKRTVLFISQYRDQPYSNSKYFLTEYKILPSLAKFCNLYNQRLFILASTESKEEKSFYLKILKNFEFNYINKKNFPENYRLLDKFQTIAFIDSTMGYEAISRNKKVAVFSSRKLKTNSNKKELFGWPNKFKRKGFFYTDSINENEIFRVMKNVTFCKNLVWKKKISFANNIIAIDKNNKKLFDILKKISK